jgi:hypothetical protein
MVISSSKKVLREERNPVKCGNRRGGPGIKWGERGREMQFAFSHKKSYLMVSLALYPSVCSLPEGIESSFSLFFLQFRERNVFPGIG